MTTFVNVGLNDELVEAFAQPAGDGVGRLGQLPPLPAVLGHVLRHRPRLLRRHHDRVQGALRRGAEARLHRRRRCARSRSRTSRAPATTAWCSSTSRSPRWSPACARCWSRGTRRRRACTASTSAWPRSGARPSSCSAWSSATSAASRARASRSPTTRSSRTAARCACSATSPCAARARTWSAASCSRGPSPRRSASAASPTGAPSTRSSATSPRSTGELLAVARDLVGEREFDPQEIEFTFESPAASDLYILQKRSAVQEQTRDAAYFDTTSPNYGPPVAVGMGVAGGAYSRPRGHQRRADRPAAGRGAGREHRAAAPGHRARGHRA